DVIEAPVIAIVGIPETLLGPVNTANALRRTDTRAYPSTTRRDLLIWGGIVVATGFVARGVIPPVGRGAVAAEGAEAAYAEGTFTPLYDGYPGGARPLGPVRVLPEAEYQEARRLADNANAAIRRNSADVLGGRQIHEIQPVKFGGDPVSGFNKAYLDQPVHSAYTT